MGSPRQRWRDANRYANCDCFGFGLRIAPITPLSRWVTKHEYWNPPQRGHEIMASLVLDGLSIQEVTKAESSHPARAVKP